MRNILLLAAAVGVLTATPALACTDISSKVVKLTACVDDQWQTNANAITGATEFYYLTSDQNFGLQVVTETDAAAAAALQEAILNNAATAAGGKDNVKLINSRVESVDGKAFNVVEFTVTDGKTTLTYQNLYYSAPGFGTVQVLALSTPEMATQAAFKEGQFAQTIKLGG